MKQLETSLTDNRSNLPSREFHVTVWDEEETTILNLPEDEELPVEDESDVVDDLPTSPLMITGPSTISTPTQADAHLPGAESDEEEVAEELPTSPLITSLSQGTPPSRVSSSRARDISREKMSHEQIEEFATRPYAAQPRAIAGERVKPVHLQKPVTPMPILLTQIPAEQPVRQTPPVSMPVPPLARPEKHRRKRLAVVLGLLLVLLLAGVIAWVVVYQPFAVPEITRTTQNFHDTSLGVSLQYPQHWAVVVKKQSGSVNFYDDNYTDQVNITVVAAGNQSMTQYLGKTVSTLGMTGQRTQPELSFAGATWQQVQGSIQQSGATYTATLLLTLHGGRYYTILQLAPSSTYPLEERLVFAAMRSSLQLS